VNDYTLRTFIRESIKSKDNSLNEFGTLLLPLLVPAANVGDDPNPCVSLEQILDEQEREKYAYIIAGLGLAGISVFESGVAAAAAWRAGAAARATGSIVRAMFSYAMAGLNVLNIVYITNCVLDLIKYCTSSGKDLSISEFDRNRKIAGLMGDLYIGFALSGVAGTSRTGKEVIDLIKSSKTFGDFTKSFYAALNLLRVTDNAKWNAVIVSVNSAIGWNFQTWYDGNALEKIRMIDPNVTYTIDAETTESLMSGIAKDKDNVTFTNAEIMRSLLIARIRELCSEKNPAKNKAEIDKYYAELQKILYAQG